MNENQNLKLEIVFWLTLASAIITALLKVLGSSNVYG